MTELVDRQDQYKVEEGGTDEVEEAGQSPGLNQDGMSGQKLGDVDFNEE